MRKSTLRRIFAERKIVERCLAGDGDARQELFEQYDHGLRCSIGRRMRRGSTEDVVAEIAARVWFALVRRNYCDLRRYDWQRSSLANYLGQLARRQLQELRRAQMRRR